MLFRSQKYMRINYDLKSIAIYTVVALALFGASFLVDTSSQFVNLSYRTVLLIIFVALIVKRDFPLSQIPVINRFVQKK